jgi:hypothetical protein
MQPDTVTIELSQATALALLAALQTALGQSPDPLRVEVTHLCPECQAQAVGQIIQRQSAAHVAHGARPVNSQAAFPG